MKKFNFFRILVSLVIPVLLVFAIFTSTIVRAQPLPPELAGKVFAAWCCKCVTGVRIIDRNPRMPGYCRECHLLCPNCVTEMGGLDKGLEDLKLKIHDLNLLYQQKNIELQNVNKNWYKAATNITGEREGTKGWTLDGLYGSFGGFSVSLLSLASNFTPTSGSYIKIVDKKWFSTGLTLVTNGIGIYQTASGRSDYSSTIGIADEVASWSGVLVDFVTTDFWNWIDKTLRMMDEKKMIRDISEGTPLVESFVKYKTSGISPPPRLTPEAIKDLEKISLLTDIWAMGRSTMSLLNDLVDLGINWDKHRALEKELSKIGEEIFIIGEMIICIRETQDFLNKKGTGFRSSNFIQGMAMYFMTPPAMSNFNRWLKYNFNRKFSEMKFSVDEIKLTSAISKLKKMIAYEEQNVSILSKKVFPAFFPWITNKWKKYEPRTLIQMLQKTKAPFQDLIKRCDEMTQLFHSIKNDLKYAVIFEMQISDGSGNIENSVLSEYSDGFYLIENEDSIWNTASEQWSFKENKKLLPGKGRLNLIYPANVDWSVDIYTSENKFFTNRSSYSKHSSYDISPGKYKLKLNSIPIENVSIEIGKETKLKTGILNIVSRGIWEMYDETKKIYYTSGNKPAKRVLPVGSYQFVYEGKTYPIKIKNGMVLKFELRKPVVVDQL